MLIGGAWDPTDGADPEDSPHSLIATAIRTFKAATGIDLSACLYWWDSASTCALQISFFWVSITE